MLFISTFRFLPYLKCSVKGKKCYAYNFVSFILQKRKGPPGPPGLPGEEGPVVRKQFNFLKSLLHNPLPLR